jgi:hypothetical protein
MARVSKSMLHARPNVNDGQPQPRHYWFDRRRAKCRNRNHNQQRPQRKPELVLLR